MSDMLCAPVIVTPVYEDAESAKKLFEELQRQLGLECYVVAVDDGSVVSPLDPATIAAGGLNGVVIRLNRNVGHQRAIAIGLSYVAEHMPQRTCVVMDADGEDIPATITSLIQSLYASDDVDAIVARRGSRVETLRFRAFYAVYKFVFLTLTGRRINFGNLMALNPAAVRRLAAMQELWIHVAAALLVSKLRISTKTTDRGPRYAGQSNMNFSSLVLHGFRALMVVAEDVLVRVGIACTFLASAALAAIALSFVLKLVGMSTPGWFSTALGILILVLLQTATLTLITLMLTGVLRGNSRPADYRGFVAAVLKTDDAHRS